jgi:large subunit ribosomal protein L13
MKTYQARHKDINHNWHLIDAKGEILGRMATKVATLLIGKNKVGYTPHMDSGDFVVVINAKDVEVTGRKESQKVYRGHSGYPKGFKEVSFNKLMTENPSRIIEKAVNGMLPDNRLKTVRMKRLKVFADSKQPYEDKFREVKK